MWLFKKAKEKVKNCKITVGKYEGKIDFFHIYYEADHTIHTFVNG